MTAEPDLLPLPERFSFMEWETHMRDYASANILRHTAAQAAEIEALRAEVRTLRRQQASWERHIAAAGCEYVRDEDGEVPVNRRAEQLAGALRDLAVLARTADRCYTRRPSNFASALVELRESAGKARALLRDSEAGSA